MKPAFEIDDKVYFIGQEEIQYGVISKITIKKNEIYYDIYYYKNGDQHHKISKEEFIYCSIDALLFGLKFNYEKRGEINE
jgi:hypothetical protein